MNKIKIFGILLGISNIILGFLLALILFIMQGGVVALVLGFLYIFLGITILCRRCYSKLLFYGVLPVTVIFSLNIIMMGIDKSIPTYYQTPIWVGIIILVPFWAVTLADIFFIHPKIKERFISNKTRRC